MASNSTTSSVSSNISESTHTAQQVRNYFMAVIIPLGLLCNLLVIMVIAATRSLRRSPMGITLAVLAVADNLVLISELLISITIYGVGYYVTDTSEVACRLLYFLRYCGRMMSVSFIITIAIQRFIVVKFPLKVAIICSVRNVVIVIISIAVCAFSLCSFSLTVIGIKDGYCQYLNNASYQAFDITFGVIFEIIPCFILAGFSVIIVRNLIFMSRIRATKLSGSGAADKRDNSNSKEFQTSLIMVLVPIAFVICNVPYVTAWYINHGIELSIHKVHAPSRRARYATYILGVLKHTINFFLYCISGTSFRSAFVDMFSTCKIDRKLLKYGTSSASHPRASTSSVATITSSL